MSIQVDYKDQVLEFIPSREQTFWFTGSHSNQSPEKNPKDVTSASLVSQWIAFGYNGKLRCFILTSFQVQTPTLHCHYTQLTRDCLWTIKQTHIHDVKNFLYRISETKMIHLVHLGSAAWYNHAWTCTWKRRASFHLKKSKLKDSSNDSAIDTELGYMLLKFIYLDMKDSWARGVGICYCPQKFTIG